MTTKSTHNIFFRIFLPVAVALTAFCSCDECGPDTTPSEDRKVLLLYSAGHNSISSYLKEDIEDLCKGWTPTIKGTDDVLLVYSHQPKSRGQYTAGNPPVLMRIYHDPEGVVIRDTLVTYQVESISASAQQLNEVLTYVKDNFIARSYGMVFSSHATGYLPAGFYSKPNDYSYDEGMTFSIGRGRSRTAGPKAVPYVETETDPDLPAVKSVGQTVVGKLAYEMELTDFAEAIPMKLDYILFDACLMGGIEVAYELAGKTDLVGFSQAEVLAEGFNYTSLADHLLGNKQEYDVYNVCKDYFDQYDIQTGVNRSATISLVDCSKLEPVAEVCSRLFSKYSEGLENIRPNDVQRYYRSSHHWFYDLESIIANAGATAEEIAELQAVIEGCMLYKGATPSFLGEFDIHTFSGFSMYLPCNGNPELDKFYMSLKWNQATALVK